MRFSRQVLAWTLLAFLFTSARFGWATTVDSITPSRAINDICIGDQITWTAKCTLTDGDQVVDYQWQYKINGCNPDQITWIDWGDTGGDPTITSSEPWVGPQTVKVRVNS